MKLRPIQAGTVAVLAFFGLTLAVLAQEPIRIQLQPAPKDAEGKQIEVRPPVKVLVRQAPQAPAVQGGDGISFLHKALDKYRVREVGEVRADAKALARRIDEIIEARLAKEGVKAGPPANPGLFLRRLTLDLSGRIPEANLVEDYLDPEYPRDRAIDELLDNPRYAKHFAAYFRSIMLPGNDNQQVQFLQYGFESWLADKLQRNTGYDKIVHELMTMAQPFNNQPNSPSAFFVASEFKPENLAGSTSRVFLGVKLECAQCHAHPFAKWTKNQFWEYTAFFSGIRQNPRRPGGLDPFSKEIKIPNTEKTVKAKFLTGEEPEWPANVPTMTVLADWMTSGENPYFARAAVDHIWQHFFGVSLLEPILETQNDGMPTHPELLDELARDFVAHQFDVKYLVRAIVQTKAYERASTGPAVGSNDVHLFARMPVRGMSPEQLFDSMAEATDYHEPQMSLQQQQQFNQFNGPRTPRGEFLLKFASQDKRIDSQTSILQALFLMNGKFLAERVKLENNKSLHTIATNPNQSTADRVASLYRLVLSRQPRPDESERFVRFIDAGGATGNRQQAIADVYWALLNSAEFMLNH